MKTKTFALAGVAALGLAATAALAEGEQFTVDLTGVESWDAVGSANNTVLLVDVAAALGYASGTGMSMTGIGWDVSITPQGASWASEARMYFDDNIAPDGYGLFLSPFGGTNYPETSYSPVIKLADYAIPDIELADGILRIEFYESFDDVAGEIDGIWGGSITIQAQVIPAPAAAAVFGLAGLVGSRRRRG